MYIFTNKGKMAMVHDYFDPGTFEAKQNASLLFGTQLSTTVTNSQSRSNKLKSNPAIAVMTRRAEHVQYKTTTLNENTVWQTKYYKGTVWLQEWRNLSTFDTGFELVATSLTAYRSLQRRSLALWCFPQSTIIVLWLVFGVFGMRLHGV